MKNAIQTSIPIESRITDVTVYLSGAQVTRKCLLPMAQGIQSYVFQKLPAGLQPESIQFFAGDGIVIRSVEHTLNHMQTVDYSNEITALQQKLGDFIRSRQEEYEKIELGNLEVQFFEQNMKLAGTETGLKADELKAAVLFYNERMAAIRETRMNCTQKIEELEREITAIQLQLGGYSNFRPDPVSEITVTTEHAGDAAEKELILSYFVCHAGWKPSYDIRAKDVTGDISLHYKARVHQNSGESWENVRLTLSTGNPNTGGACPTLNPWYLDFYQDTQSIPIQQFNEARMIEKAEFVEMKMELEETIPAVTMTESLISVEYNITAPYTVNSGDGGQDVEIKVHSLPAVFRYFCIRKLKKEVFLLAAVSGWEHLNLIAGEASIFFENRYVGKAVIDPRKGSEKIDLSLGVDPSVIVTRVRGKDFTSNTFTGGSVKQSREWELTVRNLKTVPVEIELLDHIPISVNKQISVDAAEISDAQLNKDTGILTWKFTLAPAKSKSVTVKYVVTSPKNTTVILD